MEKQELVNLMKELESVFEVVRLVDVDTHETYQLKNGDVVKEEYKCYALWNRNNSCMNCSSKSTVINENKQCKYETKNNKIYNIISTYVKYNDRVFALEMAMKLQDSLFKDPSDKDKIINNIKQYNKELYLDPLTGAYNRRYYNTYLIDKDEKTAMAMVDLDDFKEINDTYGHLVGDEVLKQVVLSIQNTIRSNDYVIRYGGDEFIIYFTNIDEEVFKRRISFICDKLKTIKIDNYPDINVSASIGGAYYNTKDDMLKQADSNMYEAKKCKGSVYTGD